MDRLNAYYVYIGCIYKHQACIPALQGSFSGPETSGIHILDRSVRTHCVLDVFGCGHGKTQLKMHLQTGGVDFDRWVQALVRCTAN